MDALAVLDLDDGPVTLRRAVPADLPELVALLADDVLGAGRENVAALAPYASAFDEISAADGQLLVTVATPDRVIGTMQLSFLPGCPARAPAAPRSRRSGCTPTTGGRRIGEFMIRWAVAEAGRRGCAVVQLTTDKSRAAAHRFYRRLGFAASHEGMKLSLG